MPIALIMFFHLDTFAQQPEVSRPSYANLIWVKSAATQTGIFPANFVEATISRPRLLVQINIPIKPIAEGIISVYSEKEGFFTLKFKTENQINQLPATIPELLSKVKFHSTAISQSQFKNQNLDSLADRSFFSIVTLMTSGHAHNIQCSREAFQNLIKMCPSDGSINFFADDSYLPTDLSVAKVGGKLSSIRVKNKLEESEGVYESPLVSTDGRWGATLTIQPRFNPDQKIKTLPEKLTLKLEKQKTIYSNQDIDKILSFIFSAIPKKTGLMLSNKDTQIPMEWGNDGFQPLVVPEAIQAANDQRMKQNHRWTSYTITAGGLLVCLVIACLWKYKRFWLQMVFCIMLQEFQSSAKAQYQDGPYCGLYCVKAAAAALGRDIPFDQIRHAKYLSANPGSTTDDLVRALSLAKLNATPRPFISISRLYESDHPILLHTRSPGATEFNHWVLFLGSTGGGKVSVYDPPLPQKDIALSELMSVWDGFGLEVTVGDPIEFPIPPLDWMLATFFAGIAYYIFQRYVSPGYSVIAAGLLVSVYSEFSHSNFLQSPRARGIISANYFPRTFHEIKCDSLHGLWLAERCVVIDTRIFEDHMRIRIPGSYSLPVNAGLGQLLEVADRIPKNSLVVCYCNNSNCGWSDMVANQLYHLGYSDISIFRGGMQDWVQNQFPVEQ